MPNIGHNVRGFASLIQHRYLSHPESGHGGPDEEALQRFQDKVAKLCAGKKDDLKNTSRLEVLGAQFAQIPVGDVERRSTMVSMLAARLVEIAHAPEQILTESHIQEMCRLLLENTCHVAYRDTPEAKYPERTWKMRSHHIPHSAALWGLEGGWRAPLPCLRKTMLTWCRGRPVST